MTRHPALLTLCLALTACGSADGGTPDGGVGDAGTDAQPLKTLGQSCGGDSECDSGNCVDSVCCDQPKTSCGTCMRCDLAASKGTCTAVAKGDAPRDTSECAGDVECGANTCDGAGGCDYKAEDTLCSETCPGTTVIRKGCTTKGTCEKALQGTSCEPYVCDKQKPACLTACNDGLDCISGSACDLSQLHLKGPGQGVCVDPTKVETVGTGTAISAAIANAKGKKEYVLIPKGSYTETLTISNQTVTLIGEDQVTINAKDSSTPLLTVNNQADVSLQNINLQGATNTNDDGIFCKGSTNQRSTLTVLDSTIKSNPAAGINAQYCDVTVRRSRIESNKAGGLYLKAGVFTIVNTLVVDNTGATAVTLSSPAANTVFAHNTIANNTGAGLASALQCASKQNESHWGNIIYNNTGGQNETIGCPDPSTVCSLLTPQDPKLSSGTYIPGDAIAFDQCDPPSSNHSAVDYLGHARPKGNSKTDIGAHEVQ